MKLDRKQKDLFEFVKKMHGDQKRKYTGEPYYNHPLEVAELVSQHEEGCIEIALCHDLFEDTDCHFDMLYKQLMILGYPPRQSYGICNGVVELTDVFTKEDYPHLNREKRKQLEAKRLGTISYKSQSIKYADLIKNTESIVEHDERFAKIYLTEANFIMQLMNEGNFDLFMECMWTLIKSYK